jgi:hypothetical protein
MRSYDARFSKIHQEAPMLVPDNIHPEQTIYFNGAFVLVAIQENRVMDLLDLYIQTKSKREMSMPVFLLCLDWLFLLDLVTLNSHGKVELCS